MMSAPNKPQRLGRSGLSRSRPQASLGDSDCDVPPRDGVPTRNHHIEPLALRAAAAAKALGIGENLLWSLTNRGEVPHARIGRRIVYPIDELKAWLSKQAQKKGGGRR